MQHVLGFGYPTPPASPVYDEKSSLQQPVTTPPHCQTGHVPLRPEERLGMFLEGKLQLTSILGTGAYGVVYTAVDVNTGLRYAVKCLSKFNPDGTPLDRRQVAFQNREIRLHYFASTHENVLSLLKIVDDPDCIYVILEYCPEGDLFYNITERGRYVGKDDLARRVFLQILDAVEHCHSLGIYHRDLKPENILVTDQGETVKLADFGLATADDRSEDYGCGSTFYMSPECLDHSSRNPFYLCAPNDVWSLGVILVNLTCGRNPWKQASFDDSTYRAFSRNPGFLKTILPVTDELNDILGRIFTRDPEQRITLRELRTRIMGCSGLTVPAAGAAPLPTPPVSPAPSTPQFFEYVHCEDAVVDQDHDDACLSPASSSDDDGSICSHDSSSLTSSVSTLDDLDEDFLQEQQQQQQQNDQRQISPPPRMYEPEEQTPAPFGYPVQEFVPQQPPPPRQGQGQHYTGPVSSRDSMVVQVPAPLPVAPHVACVQQPKTSYFPFWWDMVKCVQQQGPAIQPHIPFHHQVPLFSQGCY
ncbi:Pkinase-domain-containing protein [Sodiomyces alkalinus F11]|uniref:Autophagy-related protein 1 n=1 Tax=Sodiomyces alkalinus (strain CBS 110278 / VKM F-3762 / F11) TaxID=1314773 RepID=A0A3N2Q573_SODAK|nr:Pkinase-domain-containing protein [Sodiomyces alkalinus F11]ROT41775.1 Pkinase-domain-containing protein [Sodiomyces alkalinus F11]